MAGKIRRRQQGASSAVGYRKSWPVPWRIGDARSDPDHGGVVLSPFAALRISYRPATAGDAPAIVDVHYAAVQAVDRRHYSDEVLAAWSPLPDATRRQWLADLVSRESTLCTVAVSSGDAIVGFCIAIPEAALLKALYVQPGFTGQGIGQGLLSEMEARCRALGLEALELNASHNAEAFYRSCGYEARGPVVQPLTDTVSMEAIRMIKQLSGVA